MLRKSHNNINNFDFSIPSSFASLIPELEEVVGVKLNHKKLWVLAFKHRSYLNITHENRIYSNERLEFLGDAVVNLSVTRFLYDYYPEKDEGTLSKMKAILLSKEVLGNLATGIGLGRFLLLNKGEDKSGGRERTSILADVYEAVVGAVFWEKGLEAAENFINGTLLKDHNRYLEHDSLQNFKSILLEYAQQNNMELPKYHIVKEKGPDHDKMFFIGVELNGKRYGSGHGKNKKNAEQKAAAETLRMLGLI